MKFFFDRCVPQRLARILDAYDTDNTIIHQDDDSRFDEATPDTLLIETLASEDPKPVFVTADIRMRRNPVERIALADSDLTVVFLRPAWHDLDFHMQAVKLLKLWPSFVEQVERCREATEFEVTPSAKKLQRLGPTCELKHRAKKRRQTKRTGRMSG